MNYDYFTNFYLMLPLQTLISLVKNKTLRGSPLWYVQVLPAKKFSYIKLKNSERKVLLLVDNCAGNFLNILILSNINIRLIPPNMTSCIQESKGHLRAIIEILYLK